MSKANNQRIKTALVKIEQAKLFVQQVQRDLGSQFAEQADEAYAICVRLDDLAVSLHRPAPAKGGAK